MNRSALPAVAALLALAACVPRPAPRLPDPPADRVRAGAPAAASADGGPAEPVWVAVPHPPGADSGAAVEESADRPPADELLRLDRSGCGFVCPSYSLVIRRDGSVEFLGRAHTLVQGLQRGTIDSLALARLVQTLAGELPALQGDYVPGSARCGPMATDQPTVRLWLQLPDGVLQTRHYIGCSAAPARLTELEDLVDATAQSAPWVRHRTVR